MIVNIIIIVIVIVRMIPSINTNWQWRHGV